MKIRIVKFSEITADPTHRLDPKHYMKDDHAMRTPHQITITIDTSNAIFDDHETGECAKQLRHIAKTLTNSGPRLWSHDPRGILDTNGNTCGTVAIETIL
jgi:hypothetical protein